MKMAFQKNNFYPSVMLDRDYRQPKKGAESKIKGKESKTVTSNKLSIGELFVNKMKAGSKASIKSPAILQDCKVKMTFQQLDEISTCLAKYLVNSINNTKDIRPNKDGDVVVAIIVNELEELDERLVTFLIACAKAGLTFMVLDTATNRVDDLEWALSLVSPVMVVSGNRVSNNIGGIISNLKNKAIQFRFDQFEDIWKAVTLENMILRSIVDSKIPVLTIEDPESWLDQPHFDRTVGIYFSAGSEGLPHGVRVSSREIFNRIHWQNKVFPIEVKDEFTLTSFLTDPRSLAQIFVPLLAGKSVTIIPYATLYNAPKFFEAILAGRLTRITLTPPLYMTLIEEAINNVASREKLASLTHLIVTGDSLTESMARKFFTVFPTALASGKMLIATYGTTELLGEATYEIFQSVDDLVLKSLEQDPEILSVGVPITNTSVIVVDRNESSVPVGSQGEIMFSGAVVSSALRGYSGQGSGIAAQLNFNDRMMLRGAKKRIYYKTGDYGRILQGPNGTYRLYIEGRTETEKIVEGKHVNFQEIDESVKGTQLVKDAVTLVYYRGRESQVVITACVLKEGITLLKVSKAVRTIPVKKIVHYPVLFAVKRIPYLMNGRISKRELRTIFRKYVTSCDESEWDELNLKSFSQDMSTVKIFCTAVGQSIGMSIEEVIAKFDRSYWDIGGTPINAIMTIAFCAENGFFISLEDFAASAADTLSQVCERLLPIEIGTPPESIFQLAKNPNGKFEYKDMVLSDKNDVSLFIAELTDVADTLNIRKYYANVVEKVVLNYKMSIVAKSILTGRIVGAAINIPEHPKLSFGKAPTGIAYGLEFIRKCNNDARYQLWRKSNGKIMHVTFLGIDHYAYLQPAEIMVVIRDLLLQSSITAVSCGFSTLIVTTSNPLIQEIAVKLLSFESILDRQLCKFKAKNGVRPFAMADDNHLISVLMKDLSRELKVITSDAISQADFSLVSINTQHSTTRRSHSILTGSVTSNTQNTSPNGKN